MYLVRRSARPTKAYSFSNGKLSTTPTSVTAKSFGFTGGDPVVSSNGTAAGTGVLWTIDSSATLRAYDATNLANRALQQRPEPGPRRSVAGT